MPETHNNRPAPEPFAGEIDDLCRQLCEDLRDEFAGGDEVAVAHAIDEVETGSLWSRASGGWKVDFECDLSNSYSHGFTPKCLADFCESQMRDALAEWVEHDEPYPGAAEEFSAIRHPQNLRSIYEYAAEYLGKSKADVDGDIHRQMWNWFSDLAENMREAFYEVEREWLRDSYFYGLEIAYLCPTDPGNQHGEPIVEIAATFRASPIVRDYDIGKFSILPAALTPGLCDMLRRRVITLFADQ